MEKRKALVVGDYSIAPYHPLKGVDDELKEILKDCLDITFTEDRNYFNYEKLSEYDLCISYLDRWNEKLSQQHVSALISYVVQGGNLLVIHNGISIQGNSELAQLVGAKFTGHPPYQRLKYSVSEVKSPITEGIPTFEMDEELYCFTFDNLAEIETLLECSNDDITMPAAWTRKVGLGKIAYLAPGHDVKSFNNENFRKLILNSALWCVDKNS